MARGIKPEKIAGIVALSYLVLIPVGAAYIYQKVRVIDEDLTTVWNTLPNGDKREPGLSLRDFGRIFR